MGESSNLPEMKTINEVSLITGLAKYHVRKMVLNNKVKYIMAGKKYLINFNSLLDYLNHGDNENMKGENQDEPKTRKVE